MTAELAALNFERLGTLLAAVARATQLVCNRRAREISRTHFIRVEVFSLAEPEELNDRPRRVHLPDFTPESLSSVFEESKAAPGEWKFGVVIGSLDRRLNAELAQETVQTMGPAIGSAVVTDGGVLGAEIEIVLLAKNIDTHGESAIEQLRFFASRQSATSQNR